MRKQIAFATLTPAQIDQIAEWLIQGGTYNEVRERIAQPAPEGFGLQISIRPLQTLYAKKMRLNKINSHIVQGRPLTLAQFDALNDDDPGLSPERSAEVHHAILEATHELATERDHTPAQLLALQRLADFPERAALRAQRAELELAKEQRAQEMHAHKIALDLRKEARQIEADASRKEIALRRIDLAERVLQLREQQAARSRAAQPAQHSQHAQEKPGQVMEDHLGPLIRTPADLEARVIRKFGLADTPAPKSASPLPTVNPFCTVDPFSTVDPLSTVDPFSTVDPLSTEYPPLPNL